MCRDCGWDCAGGTKHGGGKARAACVAACYDEPAHSDEPGEVMDVADVCKACDACDAFSEKRRAELV